jgi:hypothetical protein
VNIQSYKDINYMNKQILSLAIALPAILASVPALADGSNTQVQVNTLQPVVATPIFNNDAADRVMRRKGPGPGGLPIDSVTKNSSVINLTNGEDRGRPKPHGPGGIPTDVKVNGSVVINKPTGEERGRPKPKGPGGTEAMPSVNHIIVAPGQ